MVSIPNGMEFYYYVCDRLMHEYVFQFPTGWNSTKQNGKKHL